MSDESGFSVAVNLNGPRAERDPDPAVPYRPRRAAPGEAAGTRRDNDAYDTSQECADGCVTWLGGLIEAPPRCLLDPTAGGGPFVRAARKLWPNAKIVATDLRAECAGECKAAGADKFVQIDALTLSPATIVACDLIVTNPPFKLADRLIRHFWPHMHDGASIAFLLSVTFQAGDDRWNGDGENREGLYQLAPLAACPPIVPRPEFGMDSGPKFEAALFVFTKGRDSDLIQFRPPVHWARPVKPRKPRKPRAVAGAVVEELVPNPVDET